MTSTKKKQHSGQTHHQVQSLHKKHKAPSNNNDDDSLEGEEGQDYVYDEFILSLTKTNIAHFEHSTPLHKKRRTDHKDLSSRHEIVVSHRDESLQSIFDKLLKNKILSCPVLKQGGLFYGMVDLLDIIKFIVDETGKKHFKKATSFFEVEEFKNVNVGQLMEYPYGKSIKYQKLSPSTSLFTAFESLAKQSINRIAVVDDREEVVDIITEFDLIHWVYDNVEKLGSRRSRKVSQINAANQYVMSVLEDEQVIDAFKLIKIMGVGGVAVIQENGTLVGNLSARDIKKIGNAGENWKRLFSPVFEFIDREPITCSLDDTLEDILEIFVNKSVHRVYIVDEMFKTIGVVTLRDIIGELMPMSSHSMPVPLFDSEFRSNMSNIPPDIPKVVPTASATAVAQPRVTPVVQ
ncbi:hypothetical protein SAMD00019534_027440 [Acytostelium subglobosum LB1]|uniref:hypothetical protein n=1 Tax=Acytostelium subglobosum LB1 TaxID=1410327 RepID=UPI000644DA3E|nr:hypothetical protein SAMD00019534_027440 [Acytostelium subglobosum LB1]GAM19569.1 hypothetical protein SAMD00019534_027440 [Acytostelium subglobosum LB1]|eukprot:XP_012757496.1 hypothetical protein SAMD00019534_027440 [Acytostelium subglobosum LB1]